MLLGVHKVALVVASKGVVEFPLTLLVVGSVEVVLPVARLCVVLPVAFVDVPVEEILFAGAVLGEVCQVPLVALPVCENVDSLAIELVIPPAAKVPVSGCKDLESIPFLLFVHEGPFIGRPVQQGLPLNSLLQSLDVALIEVLLLEVRYQSIILL